MTTPIWLPILAGTLGAGIATYFVAGEVSAWRLARQRALALGESTGGREVVSIAPWSALMAGAVPVRTLQLIGAVTVIVLGLGIVSRSLILVLAGSLLVIVDVLGASQRQRWSMTTRIRRQLPEAVDLMASALSAGGTLYSALDAAAREIPAPLGTLLTEAVARCNVNQTVAESLTQMQHESNSEEVAAIVAALEIQRTTGGNLSRLLRETSGFVREEIRLRGEARALSAQARYSAMIIGLMPLALFLLFSTLFPSYIEPLTTGSGLLVLVYCALSTAFGFFLINRIAGRMETA